MQFFSCFVFSLNSWDGSALLREPIKGRAWPPHYLSNKRIQLQCIVSNVSVQSPTTPLARFVGDDCQSRQLQLHMSNWCSGTMPSGKTVKLVLYEVLQFAALIIPIFVIMERFARLICEVKGHDLTAYWLVVAVSIAYVTSATLLVWVPLKYLILKKRRFVRDITLWWVLLLKNIYLHWKKNTCSRFEKTNKWTETKPQTRKFWFEVLTPLNVLHSQTGSEIYT